MRAGWEDGRQFFAVRGRGGPWPVFDLAGARLVDFGADSVEVGSARFDRVASSGDARFTEAVPPTAPGSGRAVFDRAGFAVPVGSGDVLAPGASDPAARRWSTAPHG